MIVGWLGRVFRAVARVRATDGSVDLDHVGGEMVRLEQRRVQRASSPR